MKKFIIAALAASVATTPLLAAPHYGNDNRGRYEQSQRKVVKKVVVKKNDRYGRNQYRNWQRGQRFESRYARNYRVISNPRAYRLRDAPRGYRWVQSGNDAVMIAITSGIIASVLSGAFR